MSATERFVTGISEERLWQTALTKQVQRELKPTSVLEVGYPKMRESLLDIWKGAVVDTVDPHVEAATFQVRMEQLKPQRRYDLVNMTSVFDYFDDPIQALRVAASCADSIIIQGRLNTYQHEIFRCGFLVPTAAWVEDRLRGLLGMGDAEIWYFGTQMFHIHGKMRWVGYD